MRLEFLENLDLPEGWSQKKGDWQRGREEIQQVVELDTKDFIVVPYEFTGERYRASISPERLRHSKKVEKAGRSLGLELENTSEDYLGRPFIGNINWQNSMNLLEALGVSGTSVEMKNDYLRLLDEGRKGNIPVYTKAGKKLDPCDLEKFWKDSVKVSNPWRAEYFDSAFEQGEDGLYVWTENKTRPEKLDEDTLKEDRNPGISLEDWIKNSTEQGLVREKVEKGDLYSWAPENGAVAGFDAGFGRAVLGCYWGPLGGVSHLGVRPAVLIS